MLNTIIERGLDSGKMNSSIDKLNSLTVYQKGIMIISKCQAGVSSGCYSRSSMASSGSHFSLIPLLSSDRSSKAVFAYLFCYSALSVLHRTYCKNTLLKSLMPYNLNFLQYNLNPARSFYHFEL